MPKQKRTVQLLGGLHSEPKGGGHNHFGVEKVFPKGGRTETETADEKNGRQTVENGSRASSGKRGPAQLRMKKGGLAIGIGQHPIKNMERKIGAHRGG